MEHWVYFPRLQDFQLIGERREDFGYLEGSFSFGSEFGVDNVSFEVSGFKPYLVFNDERCEFQLNSALHGLSGKFMGSRGFISCLNKFIKSLFYSRKVGFVGDIRECLWFISHDEIEQGFIGGGVGSDVMDKFCHRYLFSPFRRI